MSPRGRGRARWRLAGASGGLALALLLGCPRPDDGDGREAPRDPAPAVQAPDPEFRRQAHAKALAALRKASLPALRSLDPVAAAEVEGTPLRPPGFGAAARAELRAALDEAQRQAEGLSPGMLSPEDGVVLRVLTHSLERGRHRLERPPWRDDPGALVHAVEPYLEALRRGLAAGRCDDGCGLAELGPALEAGVKEIGSASIVTLAAAREDLAALRRELPGLCGAPGSSRGSGVETGPGRAPQDGDSAHAERAGVGSPDAGSPAGSRASACDAARPGLEAALDRIDARFARAAAGLASAPEQPWDHGVAPAEPEAWRRRPSRWSAAVLRVVLEHEEAYGVSPAALFDRMELTVARLRTMREREAARGGPEAPAIARPFDATACEAAWAPLRGWVQAQGSHLVAALDCAGAPWTLPPGVDDAAIVRHLLTHGVIEPTRRAHVAATGVDVALARGRAAPLAQALVLEIAIASGSGRSGAMQAALREAHQRACLAAVAVWIHGELGDEGELRRRLDAHACGELEPLVTAAEARPRAALRGLGLVLVGDGPADAAALDRYFWAPVGLVRDLAMPPPPVETAPATRIEELGDRETAGPRLEAPGTDGSGREGS